MRKNGCIKVKEMGNQYFGALQIVLSAVTAEGKRDIKVAEDWNKIRITNLH
jgi:hypothetical protein